MSVDLLSDLQLEVRRLFIAGSALAEGDMRVSKLLPLLRKLGESAPVFNRLADAAETLVSSSREESPVKLLELATLLSAVLHTQGKTETAGELQTIDGAGLTLTTDISYRKLQPLIEALTTKGQGRLEQLRQADEDRSFLDLRALPAACSALDDSYAEIPDYIQENWIPEYGIQAVPVLRSQLDLHGGKGDARRLRLLHRLQGAAVQELLLEAATTGSPELKVAAISMLGEYKEHEALLLEVSREKRKEVRAAAYSALSKLGSAKAIDRLFEAVTSKDRELALEAVQECRSVELHRRLIAQADEDLDRFLGSAGSELEAALQQLHIDLRSLEEADRELSDDIFVYLRKLLSTKAFLVPETEAVQEEAAELLLGLDILEANQFVLDLQQINKNRFIRYSFLAAYRLLTPKEVFDRFSPEMKGRTVASKELQRAINRLTATQLQNLDDEAEAVVPEDAWDPRWAKHFAQIDLLDFVCVFAHRADREITSYLTAKLDSSARFHDLTTRNTLLALFRIGYKKAPELLLKVLNDSSSRSIYYVDWRMKKLLASMPKSEAPEIRWYVENLAYESVRNELLEIVEALEAASDEPEESGKGLWGWIKSKRS
ncbi:HEAT repeat domain-containing protein [Gorillibacterium timonense]|uniref:HEAT repeat domain-containing protein n=1 Tax=Gorillibacterium timonense TaxID=1689269 RepID=UPI00071D4DA2|nr:HEAT repeat domain-containing protein [Gorillibacterium timonense]